MGTLGNGNPTSPTAHEFATSVNNRVKNRKVTELLSYMRLTHYQSDGSAFASRFVATKSPVSSGHLRAQTPRLDRFFFAFRPFCEIAAATLRLVS